jgi:hypothetical protein
MTVKSMIETTRMVTGASDLIPDPANPERRERMAEGVAVSPNRKRFVTLLIKGDVATDQVWMDVVTGDLSSLNAVTSPRVAARLKGRFRGNTDLVVPFRRLFEWQGDDQIVMRWEDASGKPQVFKVDLVAGRSEQLTEEARGVKLFTMAADGTVVYATDLPPLPQANLAETGGLVQSPDAFSLANGQFGSVGFLGTLKDRVWFIKRPGKAALPLDISGRGHEINPAWLWSISPDSRWMVIQGTPLEIPASWDLYQNGFTVRAVEDERINPREGSSARQLAALYLVDLHSGRSQMLLAAPMLMRSKFAWSPDNRSLILGPTYLPIPTHSQGLQGRAVIEMDLETRVVRQISVPDGFITSEQLDALEWLPSGQLRLTQGEMTLAYRREGDAWVKTQAEPRIPETVQAVRLNVRQDENTPPRLFASELFTGKEKLVLDPNPNLLTHYLLGRAEAVGWQSADGSKWTGRLYYPVAYETGKRYPLVIQTHGHPARGEYSLNGMGGGYPATGVGISTYVAQPLAGKGMFVLQMDEKEPDEFDNGRAEAEGHMKAVESIIDVLNKEGKIDTGRVGLSGFSRTGWHTLYALAYSDFEFAAALVSDNIDAGYFQAMLMPGYFQTENGSQPYGESLKNWLETTPGFGADRIRAPLRLQTEGALNLPYLLAPWEVFARLRHLGRPVEYHMVPDVLNGSHSLQNPTQVLASQEGAVEWFDYWLNDDLPGAVGSRERVEQLEKLKQLRNATKLHPRPPRLTWSAEVHK